MSTLTVEIPNSIRSRLDAFAEADGVSVNQLVASAVAEKLAALDAMETLRQRTARGDREKFLAVMAKVPDVPPEPGDELPPA